MRPQMNNQTIEELTLAADNARKEHLVAETKLANAMLAQLVHDNDDRLVNVSAIVFDGDSPGAHKILFTVDVNKRIDIGSRAPWHPFRLHNAGKFNVLLRYDGHAIISTEHKSVIEELIRIGVVTLEACAAAVDDALNARASKFAAELEPLRTEFKLTATIDGRQKKTVCPECLEEAVSPVFRRRNSISFRGDSYDVEEEFIRCAQCGSEFDTFDLLDPLKEVYRQYRAKNGLLQPEDMARLRSEAGLTWQELSAATGIDERTLVRYENGLLQTDDHDRLIQQALASAQADPNEGK